MRVPFARRVGALVGVLGLALTVAATLVIDRSVARDERAQFRGLATEARSVIARRLESYASVLIGARTLFTAGDPGPAAFERAVAGLDLERRFPGLSAVAFDRFVPDDNGGRYLVEYLAPAAPANVGLDVGDDPVRRAAIEEARDSGELVATAPTASLNEPGQGHSLVVLYLPVYDPAKVPMTDPERRRAFLGVLATAFRVPEVLGEVVAASGRLVKFEIYDVGRTIDYSRRPLSRERLLFDSDGEVAALDTESATDPHTFLDLDVNGRRWRVFAEAGPGFTRGSERLTPWFVAIGGATASIVAAAWAASLMGTRRRRRDATLRSFLDFTPDAAVIADTDGTIRFVNRQADELFGYAPGALVGQPLERLVPERLRGAHASHRSAFLGAPETRPMGSGLDLSGVRADGSEFPVDISIAPLRTDEGVLLAAAVRDVSERKEAERVLARALEQERVAVEELRRADHVKDEFLDLAAHELRTPLTAIVGFTELLSHLDDISVEQAREFISHVATNAFEMAQMVERLLDFSRLRAGRVTFEREKLRIADCVDDSLAAIGAALDRHQLVSDIPGDLVAIGDADAFAHVFRNLVSNAAKFSAPGSPIVVSGDRTDGRVRVSVRDQGVGIPAAELDQVFERFYQASTRPSGVRGTGVGLSIVREYLDHLGGEVGVESEPGVGSTFWFTLPAAQN